MLIQQLSPIPWSLNISMAQVGTTGIKSPYPTVFLRLNTPTMGEIEVQMSVDEAEALIEDIKYGIEQSR